MEPCKEIVETAIEVGRYDRNGVDGPGTFLSLLVTYNHIEGKGRFTALFSSNPNPGFKIKTKLMIASCGLGPSRALEVAEGKRFTAGFSLMAEGVAGAEAEVKRFAATFLLHLPQAQLVGKLCSEITRKYDLLDKDNPGWSRESDSFPLPSLLACAHTA
jgi:hypothetical protein